MKKSAFLVFVLALSCFASLGVARDGTLPIHLDGIALDGDAFTHNADLFFDDGAIISGSSAQMRCKLAGAQKFDAAGTISIGDKSFSILGTCKDPNSNRYEVVAKDGSRSVSFLGNVQNINTGVNFKGSVSSPVGTYNFDLK